MSMKIICNRILALMLVLVYGLMSFAVTTSAKNTTPPDVTGFQVLSVSSSSLKLSWNSRVRVSGYEIYLCDKNAENGSLVADIANRETTEITLKNLKAETVYRYIIYSYVISDNEKIYSDKSPVLTVSTEPASENVSNMKDKVSKGYSADITNRNISVNGNLLTTVDSECKSFIPDYDYGDKGLLITCHHGDYGDVSDISQFFDYKGYYNIAYESGNYLYIERYTTALKKVSSLKIKKKYKLVGDVTSDENGNYYVVWGKDDDAGNGGVVTIAVSKYNYKGEFIKTTGYKTEGGIDSWDTQYPFDAGNCDTTIDSKGILVCTYARQMYNGHQSNDVICIDTSTMEKVSIYDNYASHSFDQRVIALSSGGVCFVNKGDAYPRAFEVEVDFGTGDDDYYIDPDDENAEPPQNYYSKTYELFHFYGESGANYINAWLGGVVEVGGNIFLVGSSAKSMTSSFNNEAQNLFIQLVDSERVISGSSTRKGKSCGESYTDTGVKWLTSYKMPYTVSNPQVVSTDEGNIVVMWEKMKNESFVQSYYTVLSADGTVIQKTTPMNKIRLNSHEDPIYKSGYVYWTTAGRIEDVCMYFGNCGYYGYKLVDGDSAVIHKLKVGSLSYLFETPVLKKAANTSSGIKLSWEKVNGADKYDIYRKTGSGKYSKIGSTSKTAYTDKKVKSGKKYYYTVKAVNEAGESSASKAKSILYLADTTLSTPKSTKSGITLKWKKVTGAEGYQVWRKTGSGSYKKIATVKGNSKVTYTDKKAQKGKTYTYKIKAYKSKTYSAYSNAKKIKDKY